MLTTHGVTDHHLFDECSNQKLGKLSVMYSRYVVVVCSLYVALSSNWKTHLLVYSSGAYEISQFVSFIILWLDHFIEEVTSKAAFQKGHFKIVLEVSYLSKAHLWPHFVMFFGVVGKLDNCVGYLHVSLLLQDEPKKGNVMQDFFSTNFFAIAMSLSRLEFEFKDLLFIENMIYEFSILEHISVSHFVQQGLGQTTY